MSKITPELLKNLKSYLEECHKQYWHDDQFHNKGRKHKPSIIGEMAVKNECPNSTGLCQQTSIFLKKFLKSYLNEDWEIKGGFALDLNFNNAKDILDKKLISEVESSGESIVFFSGTRLLTSDMKIYGSHWWLERDGKILDLTADQFAHPGIIFGNNKDQTYIDRNNKIQDTSTVKKDAAIWMNKGFNPSNSTMNNIDNIESEFRELLVNNRELLAENSKNQDPSHTASVDL